VTELIDGPEGEDGRREPPPPSRSAGVRVAADGSPVAVLTPAGWREVVCTVNRWVVEIDWWRAPVRREYRRCLVAGGECLELCRDLEGAGGGRSPAGAAAGGPGGWTVVRRYD
jgi:hypothetical protein